MAFGQQLEGCREPPFTRGDHRRRGRIDRDRVGPDILNRDRQELRCTEGPQVPGRLQVIVEPGDAAGELRPAGVLRGLQVHHQQAIHAVPVGSALARQTRGGVGPCVAGLAAALDVEQCPGRRVAVDGISHPAHAVGVIRRQHQLSRVLRLELLGQLAADLRPAVELLRWDRDSGIPQVRFQDGGVECGANLHRWCRRLDLPIRRQVGVEVVGS